MSRVVAITGAGTGLGRALARQAVRDGDKVIAIGRNEAALVETGAGLDPALYGHKLADMADFAAVERVICEIAAEHGRIDGLFANAAVYPRVAVLDQPSQDFLDVLAVNVGGVVAACRAALLPMIATGHGRILIVGSFADHDPIPESAAYAASKGALHALTRALAAEIGPEHHDILINEWVPGALNTAMGIAEGFDPADAARWGLKLLDLPRGGPNGKLFNQGKLQEPALSLKQRIRRKIGLG